MYSTCITHVTLCYSDGGFLTRSQDSKEFAPAVPPKMMGYHDDDNSLTEQTYELPIYNEPAYLVSTCLLLLPVKLNLVKFQSLAGKLSSQAN